MAPATLEIPTLSGNPLKIPPPRGAKRPRGAAEGGARGIFKEVLWKIAGEGGCEGNSLTPGPGVAADKIPARMHIPILCPYRGSNSIFDQKYDSFNQKTRFVEKSYKNLTF